MTNSLIAFPAEIIGSVNIEVAKTVSSRCQLIYFTNKITMLRYCEHFTFLSFLSKSFNGPVNLNFTKDFGSMYTFLFIQSSGCIDDFTYKMIVISVYDNT